MGGIKRKPSRPSTYESPPKVTKRSTSGTVNTKRADTIPRPRFSPVKLASKKKSATSDGDVPSLRKAPTLTLPADAFEEPAASAKVETFTSLRKLPSGTSVGLTAAENSVTKLTSKKSSLVRHESLTKKASTEKDVVEDGAEEAGDAIAPPLPPGGLMEIVFSFDTTGSMSSCLDQVRGRVSDMIQRLKADIPGIRLAVFAHGDYCDASTYVTKWIDFGATLPELCDFVKNVESTGGGDFDECYELVLRQAQEELSWTPGSQRSLVMIGDATPHGPSYPQNKLKISWQQECKKLQNMGVRIYAVQAMNNSASDNFYQKMASLTKGRHLRLDQFSNIFDLMMAICYREGGADLFEAYEDEVRARHAGGSLNKDLENLFDDLRDEDVDHDDVPVARVPKASKVAAKRPASKVKTAPKKAKPKPAAKPKHTKASKKVVSPKVNAKRTSKVVASMRKTKLPSGRKYRENVPEAVFRETLSNVTWSRWYLGLAVSLGPNTKGRWKKRGGKKIGYRRMGLFNRDSENLAVFEVGVQVAEGSKIFATYITSVEDYVSSNSWESQLLSKNVLTKQVESVLENKSARVFVRRGITEAKTKKAQVSAIQRAKDVLLKRYDYAWIRRKRSKKPRSVKKTGILISRQKP